MLFHQLLGTYLTAGLSDQPSRLRVFFASVLGPERRERSLVLVTSCVSQRTVTITLLRLEWMRQELCAVMTSC